jgi:hypothetical protein
MKLSKDLKLVLTALGLSMGAAVTFLGLFGRFFQGLAADATIFSLTGVGMLCFGIVMLDR